MVGGLAAGVVTGIGKAGAGRAVGVNDKGHVLTRTPGQGFSFSHAATTYVTSSLRHAVTERIEAAVYNDDEHQFSWGDVAYRTVHDTLHSSFVNQVAGAPRRKQILFGKDGSGNYVNPLDALRELGSDIKDAGENVLEFFRGQEPAAVLPGVNNAVPVGMLPQQQSVAPLTSPVNEATQQQEKEQLSDDMMGEVEYPFHEANSIRNLAITSKQIKSANSEDLLTALDAKVSADINKRTSESLDRALQSAALPDFMTQGSTQIASIPDGFDSVGDAGNLDPFGISGSMGTVGEIELTNLGFIFGEQKLYDIFHPEIHLDKNYRKPGVGSVDQPLTSVQLDRSSAWEDIKSFRSDLYDVSKDVTSKLNTALGTLVVGARPWVIQMEAASNRIRTELNIWNGIPDFIPENTEVMEALDKFGKVTFGVSAAFSGYEFFNANNLVEKINSTVDLGFGAIGAFGVPLLGKFSGPVGAVGSLSYSLTGMFMETQYAQENVTTPIVDYLMGESSLARWQEMNVTQPLVDTIWSLTHRDYK